MRWLTAVAVVLAVGVLAGGTRLSDAAFTASKSNPSNQFTAASSFLRDMASGTYTGNGADNRNITGLGFQPDIVMIKSATAAGGAVVRTRTMTGDVSKPLFGTTALAANRIQALQSGGFQVGTDASVNTNGTSYQWFAATTVPGLMSVGSYIGDGLASRTISGLGYSPETVMVFSAGAQAPLLRISGATTSFRFDSATGGTANVINSLDPGGFTVGNSTSSNQNLTVYHYLTVNETAGATDVGGYTGNGVANRAISGLGFTPAFVLVRSSSTTATRAGVWRPTAVAGTSSARFNAAANHTTAITALQATGFQVGTNGDANANTNPYLYLALRG